MIESIHPDLYLEDLIGTDHEMPRKMVNYIGPCFENK